MLYNPARRDSSLDQGLLWTRCLGLRAGDGLFGVDMAEAEKRFTGFRPSYFLVRHAFSGYRPRVRPPCACRSGLAKAAPWLFIAGAGLLVFVRSVDRPRGERQPALDIAGCGFQPSS